MEPINNLVLLNPKRTELLDDIKINIHFSLINIVQISVQNIKTINGKLLPA